MGGKGRRRREKNYRAAHGGPTRLPPPPNPSQLDSLPSKLRQIMSFSSPAPPPPLHGSAKDTEQNSRQGDAVSDAPKKRRGPEDKIELEDTEINYGDDEENLVLPQGTYSGDEFVRKDEKKKRKRKQVNDLRFESLPGDSSTRSKRKDRKKKYLESKKKKLKKPQAEDNLDFPGHEKIRFGEVVKAPPKLVAIPKASKTVLDASQERVRLRAIEAYRNRKGWTSRPGLQLPPPKTASPPV
ncbi:hypothetical protein CFOL_v3_28732 [Cephalotus follicularis]|uniref:Uncharacterized protein n=1 Tax=Cephalotus follicularis TaxID=3775 RepID=A0A1Q3CYK2_CEPFO|nr:hypothetical protein CFOL_v3_28732 [Cephalotus follicularis]